MITDRTSRKTNDRTDTNTRMPVILRNEMAELVAEIDGLPILVRVLVKNRPAGKQAVERTWEDGRSNGRIVPAK